MEVYHQRAALLTERRRQDMRDESEECTVPNGGGPGTGSSLCGYNQPMLLQVLNMDQMVSHDREEQLRERHGGGDGERGGRERVWDTIMMGSHQMMRS